MGGAGGSGFTESIRSSVIAGANRPRLSVEPEPAMDFPISDLRTKAPAPTSSSTGCTPTAWLAPGVGRHDGRVVHHRHRDPIIDYRGAGCHRVFNAFTGTLLQGTKRRGAVRASAPATADVGQPVLPRCQPVRAAAGRHRQAERPSAEERSEAPIARSDRGPGPAHGDERALVRGWSA